MRAKNYFWGRKSFKWLICLLFALCFSGKASAQSPIIAYGGEIYYQYLGSSIYRVYFVFYTNCGPADENGGAWYKGYNAGGMSITDGKTTIYSTKWTNSGLSYYNTGIPASQCTQCPVGPSGTSSCSFPYGFEFHSYYTDMNVSGFSGCKLTISYSGGIRYPTIGILTGTFEVYVSTTLNRCNGDHSSPVFQEPAVMLVNKGKLVDLYQSVAPATNNDSIYYHLVPPLLNLAGPVTYRPGYAYNYPLAYSGSIPDDAKPNGFHYDPNSGELYFTPEKTDVSEMSVEADEYAKDKSGNWYLAGNTVRTNVITCDTFNTTKNKPTFIGVQGSTGDTLTICAGNTVSFRIRAYDQNNANDSLTLSAVNQTGGDLIFSSGTSPVATFSWTPTNADVSTKPYQVIITANDNATPINDVIQTAVYIFVKDSIPNVVISAQDSGCGRYNFMANVRLPEGLKYQWYADGMPISNDSSVVYTFPANGIHIADFRVTNAIGCTWDFYDTVNIKVLPNILASGGKQICVGSQTPLSAKGGLQYTWYPTIGLSSDTGANVIASPKITTHYYVSGTDTKGCKAVDTAIVVVDTIGLTLNTNTTVCSGQIAYVKAIIKKAQSYTWVNLSGIQMSDSAALYFKLVSDTQYIFSVMDSFGCTKTELGTIHPDRTTINTGKNVSVCYGDSVQLHVSGGANYFWYPEIGLLKGSKVANPYVRPPFNQDYPISFVDKFGCSINDTVKVVVSKLYQTYIQPATICDGDSVQLMASGGKSYSWSPAYNISHANSVTPLVHPDTTTTYYVTVCDTFCGCKIIDSVTVTVNPFKKVMAGANQKICLGQSTSIGPSLQTNYGYSWTSKPPGFKSNFSQNLVTPTVTTTYFLRADNLATGCGSLDSLTVTVLSSTKPQLSGIQNVCKGDTQVYVILAYNKTNTYTWKIYGGHVLAPGKNNYIVVWDSIGNDSITLVQELPGQCRDSTTFAISNSSYPGADISVAPKICIGSTSHFIDLGSQASTYQWQFGNGDTSNLKDPVYVYPAIGLYHISLLSSNGQCSSFDSATVQVFNSPVRSPVVSHTGFRQYLFDNSDSAGIAYSWYAGDGDSLNYSGIQHTYNDTGLYKVVFNYGYPWGCFQMFDTTIHVTDTLTPPPPHYIDSVYVGPNPFIDHINVSFSHSNSESVSITVFDAIGRLVMHKSMNDEPPGSYTYSINAWQVSSGIYFLKYQAGGKVTVFKIIKV